MMRRRGAPVDECSSEEDEDAFATLSKRTGNNRPRPTTAKDTVGSKAGGSGANKDGPVVQLPASTTSSMKRHHVTSNDMRKSKMKALLMELEAEKFRNPIAPSDHHHRGRGGFVPEKKGSFVDPGEEHVTTNIFVGNLAPSITEEELTDLFRQFGDLYSVKIMWPRTPEERTRNRNTGFVCFMNREDAEDSMQCDETDPFNVGRRIMMRWGKNVKKIIKRGTGGVAIAPIQKRAATLSSRGEESNEDGDGPSKRPRTEHSGGSKRASDPNEPATPTGNGTLSEYNAEKHGKDAILVEVPQSRARSYFISTVASFIAKDGQVLEKRLLELEAHNPDFSFLSMPVVDTQYKDASSKGRWEKQVSEHNYFRWRVYAFCQGDGFNTWRTDPFRMIHPNGRFWLPPALDKEAADLEEQNRRMREEDFDRRKKDRRRLMTGRQLEQARRRGVAGMVDGGAQLSPEEVDHFNLLVRKRLCASREAICAAMAFCFEKSGAAKQISRMLKEVLSEGETGNPGISVEKRISRLYLLSDVLFNSQQPGVRNAFLYRDSIERMAPDVFTSLGNYGRFSLGLMTRHKLSTAVSAVLGAWTNWSVYNPAFLDELYARFEGKEIKRADADDENQKDTGEEEPEEEDINANAVKVITETQRQNWTEVGDEQLQSMIPVMPERKQSELDESSTEAQERNNFSHASNGGKGLAKDGPHLVEDDIDGEPIDDDDFSGAPFDEDDDLDGLPLEDDDLDGEALEGDDLSTR